MKSLRLITGLVALLSLAGTVLADIPPPPPPPPTIPGTEVTLPGAVPIVLIGSLLSLAIVVIGLAILRKRQSSAERRPLAWVVMPATLISAATAGLAIWVAIEHTAHAERARNERANWRPNGPPPPRVMEPPTENRPVPPPAPTGTDK